MVNIIVIDFAGTLIKAEVIERAQDFRTNILERGLVSHNEHANPENLYKANREFVEKLTGLSENTTIQYRKNDLSRMSLTGKEVQNQMSTNLFQFGMYLAANEYKENMFPNGFIDTLKQIKKQGYQLAIVSGVREDIITGMLAIVGVTDLFDYIYGQPPILGVTNEQNLDELKKKGTITHVIGDKLSDLEAANYVSAKKNFVTWGHATGGEENVADAIITDSKDLATLFK